MMTRAIIYSLAICALGAALEGLFAGSGIRQRLANLRVPSYAVPFWGWMVIGAFYYVICFAVLYRLFLLSPSPGRSIAFALLGAMMFINAFWNYFFPALTGMVGFWATLSLNIPDFTRYAKSQKAQIRGQAIGLPPSMTLFAFIGVVVTSATAIIYGHTEWDIVTLAGRFENKIMVSLAMLGIVISTLATNIAAKEFA